MREPADGLSGTSVGDGDGERAINAQYLTKPYGSNAYHQWWSIVDNFPCRVGLPCSSIYRLSDHIIHNKTTLAAYIEKVVHVQISGTYGSDSSPPQHLHDPWLQMSDKAYIGWET